MNNNTELILIRITGLDRPGLTASITEILSKYDVTILDIGQADIHSTLSLGILFKSQEKDSGNIMKELLFKASALGINIRFYPVTVEEYEEWVNMQGKNRYILTLLGRKLTAKQIAAVTGILADTFCILYEKKRRNRFFCGFSVFYVLSLDRLTVESVRRLDQLAPYGADNPSPVFVLERAVVEGVYAVSEGKHCRLRLRQGNSSIYAVWFGMHPEQVPYSTGDVVDAAISLSCG